MLVYFFYTKLECYGFREVISNGYVWSWFFTRNWSVMASVRLLAMDMSGRGFKLLTS